MTSRRLRKCGAITHGAAVAVAAAAAAILLLSLLLVLQLLHLILVKLIVSQIMALSG